MSWITCLLTLWTFDFEIALNGIPVVVETCLRMSLWALILTCFYFENRTVSLAMAVFDVVWSGSRSLISRSNWTSFTEQINDADLVFAISTTYYVIRYTPAVRTHCKLVDPSFMNGNFTEMEIGSPSERAQAINIVKQHLNNISKVNTLISHTGDVLTPT